jgi:hypothetical protein
MRLSKIHAAAMYGVGIGAMMTQDTGAPAGGTATAEAPAALPRRGPKANSTKAFPDRAALEAAKADNGYRRYVVTGPDGKEFFFHAREPDKAVSEAAEKGYGFKCLNIDKTEGGFRAKSADQLLAEMTPEARNELLRKYLGGGATPAAVAVPAGNGATTTGDVSRTAPATAAPTRTAAPAAATATAGKGGKR